MTEPATKSCCRCRVTKTMEEFYIDRSRPDGYVAMCKSCSRARDYAKYKRTRDKQIRNARSWNATHPAQYRDGQLRRNYGITLKEYDNLLEAQGGVCAICRQTSTKTLHVDHNPETNDVRGLLCGSCNRAIGMLQHDPERARSAARYLQASIPLPARILGREGRPDRAATAVQYPVARMAQSAA